MTSSPPSCPGSSRASTSKHGQWIQSVARTVELQPNSRFLRNGVDGRDKPGHDRQRQDKSFFARYGIMRKMIPVFTLTILPEVAQAQVFDSLIGRKLCFDS